MTQPSLQLNIRSAGDWEHTARILRDLKKVKGFMERIIATEARHAAQLVRQNLNSRGKLAGTTWPKLTKLTWKLKKSKRMLYETGQLRDAITAERHDGKWFVGVTSKATHKRVSGGFGGKGGKISLADLARVHEYGAVITQTWTPKQMRAFFALLAKAGVKRRRGTGKKAGAGMTVVIRIPARPFIYPVLDRLYLGAMSTVEQRIAKALQSALKLPSSRAAKRAR